MNIFQEKERPKVEKFRQEMSITSRLFAYYNSFISDASKTKFIIDKYRNDPRVLDLNGKFINKGAGCFKFEFSQLVTWYLWSVDEFGIEKSINSLEKFLNSEYHDLVYTLWVIGLKLDKRLDISSEISILPIEQMPISNEKENYMLFEHRNYVFIQKPTAAIIIKVPVKKVLTEEEVSNGNYTNANNSPFNVLSRVAALLSSIDEISCLPFYQTCYFNEEQPLGEFFFHSGGSPVYDVYGYSETLINENTIIQLTDVMTAFNSLSESKQVKIYSSLSRFSQSKRRREMSEKILDLCISLEMLLLDDNIKNDQLALSFRLRGSLLIGGSYEERKKIFKELKKLYEYRCQVAHSGLLKSKSREELNDKKFEEYVQLASKIIIKYITLPDINWDDLILGLK